MQSSFLQRSGLWNSSNLNDTASWLVHLSLSANSKKPVCWNLLLRLDASIHCHQCDLSLPHNRLVGLQWTNVPKSVGLTMPVHYWAAALAFIWSASPVASSLSVTALFSLILTTSFLPSPCCQEKRVKAEVAFPCLRDRQHSRQDAVFVTDWRNLGWVTQGTEQANIQPPLPENRYMIFFHFLLITLHTLVICSQ